MSTKSGRIVVVSADTAERLGDLERLVFAMWQASTGDVKAKKATAEIAKRLGARLMNEALD